MKKGVILSINKRFVTLLTPEGEFLKTKRQERTYEVGEEITFSPFKPKVTLSFSSFHLSFKKKAVLSVAAALLILFSILPSYSSEHVSAYMTIDVNPSIELEMNDQLEVLKLTGLNEDGKLVIDKLTNWKGKEIKTVTNRIVETTKQLGYLKGNKQIVVSTTLLDKDKKLDKNLKEEIKEISEQGNVSQTKMKVIQATKTDRKQARKQGISTGKYVEKKLNEDKEKVKVNTREPATDKNVEGNTETLEEKRESQSNKNKSNQENEKVNNPSEKKEKTVIKDELTEKREMKKQYKQKKETSDKKEKNGQYRPFNGKNKERNTFQEKNKEKNTFQEKNKKKNTFQEKNKKKNTFQEKNKKPNEKSNRDHSNHSKDKQSKERKWVKSNEKTEQRIDKRRHPSVKEKAKESEKSKDHRIKHETKKGNKTERNKRKMNNKENGNERNIKKSPA
ncbi:anti-sigma factor domain-containing protein [Peribacillus butanolivorans]|uniref:anti-sigma factor domain-containing protein n=1 Tax=Peribacillus butanolivorans TaxID=421767 RepID=UPI00207C5E42|nr:anti-sigma factor domain-containing protein [Peribacillus butanolivorans]MCO0600318.1 anti-sigma factor domain-containing protein [Peribacillus butanolivorans]